MLSTANGLKYGDDVSVLFERGDKSVSTCASALVQGKKNGILTTNFNETLQLTATMFKDGNGVFQVY